VEVSNDRRIKFGSFGYRCQKLPTRPLEIRGVGDCGWAFVVIPSCNTLGLVGHFYSQSILI
jgi:hypothetical protein